MAALFAVAVVFVLAGASPVASHAILERSTPPANAAVMRSPRQIVLRFSEPVDRGFSSVRITDAAGTAVPVQVTASADGRELTATVERLPQGIYTVRWRVLSTFDGHTTAGFFLLGVGRDVPSGLAGQATEPVRPAGIAARWLAFAAAAALVGGAVFQAVVLRPAPPWLSTDQARRATAVISTSRSVAAVALLAGTVGDFLVQASTLLGVSWGQALAGGAVWGLLGATRLGWSAMVRVAMALIFLIPPSPQGRIWRVTALVWLLIVAAIVAAFGGPTAVTGTMLALIVLTTAVYGIVAFMLPLVARQVFEAPQLGDRWVLPVAGALLLAGFTISSHASVGGPLPMLADWLHLAAVASWIGGLLALLLVLVCFAHSERASLARALVPRMSALAAVGLAAVVITGVYSSILYIPVVQAFVDTPYGRLLMAKLFAAVILAGLGAVNRYLMRPRLESGKPAPVLLHRFTHLVSAEVAAAAVIVLIVAVLTITPPAATTWKPATVRVPLRLAGLADDVRVGLAVSPAEPGWNRFEVAATDRTGPLTGADVRVLLRLTKLDESLDPVLLGLQDQGAGRFLIENTALGLSGWWEVEVIVRRRGRIDVSTSFPLRLGDREARRLGPSGGELLGMMWSTMLQLRSWREAQQMTDGAGNVATSWFDFVHPNRLRYRTATGTEAVIVGQTQYIRVNGGPWETRTLPNPFWVDDYLRSYIGSAQGVMRGPEMPCGEETCALVLWEAPGGSAAFAAWVGLRTYRMHKLLMSAPSHFMTSRLTDFNADLRIRPPR